MRPFRAKKCPFLAIFPSTNTCCSKKFTDWLNNHWDHFGQKSVRFWPSLHTVQKNSQIDSKLSETISGKKASVFGHHYIQFRKILRLTRSSLRPSRAKKCPCLATQQTNDDWIFVCTVKNGLRPALLCSAARIPSD